MPKRVHIKHILAECSGIKSDRNIETVKGDGKMNNKPKINAEDMQYILQEMLKIFKTKNSKYGNSFEKDEWNRLENLIMHSDDGTDDERLQDTLVDMANYCIMTLMYVVNKESDDNGNSKYSV